MAKIDFTLADLQATKLGYEEGQAVTTEVLKRAEKAYQVFHDKFLNIAPQFIGVAGVRYHFIAYDTALEYFMLRAKDMVAHQRSDSLEIFGCYLEYIDSYNELSNLIKKAFKVSDV